MTSETKKRPPAKAHQTKFLSAVEGGRPVASTANNPSATDATSMRRPTPNSLGRTRSLFGSGLRSASMMVLSVSARADFALTITRSVKSSNWRRPFGRTSEYRASGSPMPCPLVSPCVNPERLCERSSGTVSRRARIARSRASVASAKNRLSDRSETRHGTDGYVLADFRRRWATSLRFSVTQSQSPETARLRLRLSC
jgi:hypothetical protein